MIGTAAWSAHACSVNYGIKGVVIPGWQLALMTECSQWRILPKVLRYELQWTRRYDRPFWTPDREDISAFAEAFREYLVKRTDTWDPEIFSHAPSFPDCHRAVQAWARNYDTRTLSKSDSGIRSQWRDAFLSCQSIDVLEKLPEYSAQYLGVSRNGQRVLYVKGHCYGKRWWDRVSMFDIFVGGNCIFHAYFDPDSKTVTKFYVN